MNTVVQIPSDVRQAAQQINALINARPQSPRPEEIAAIIQAFVQSRDEPHTCPHCSGLDREYGPACSPGKP